MREVHFQACFFVLLIVCHMQWSLLKALEIFEHGHGCQFTAAIPSTAADVGVQRQTYLNYNCHLSEYINSFFFGERQIIVSYLLKKRLDQLMLLKSWLSQKPVLRWKKKTFVKSWLQGTGIQIDRGNCSAFSLLNFSPLLQNPFRFLSFFWCQSQGQAVGFTNKGAKERMLDYQQSKNAHRCQTIASSSEEPETKIDGCRSSREKATVIIIAHQFPCQVTFVLLSATQSVHKQKSDVDSTAAKIKLNFQMAELIY